MLIRTRPIVTVAVSLVLMATVAPTGLVAQEPSNDVELEEAVAAIEAETAEASRLLDELRSERLHLAAVIDVTGTDPADILDWVATNTTWVPYEGVLRGAQGALMDRMGNSLDRALLLAALLREAGVTDMRLARGSLLPDAVRPLESNDGLGAGSADGATLPVEVATYRDAAVEVAAELTAFLESGDGAVASTAPSLATDHWWVQLGSESGDIVDLDPLYGPEAGARPVAEATYATDGLPDELRQALTISLITERFGEDGLTTEVPLSWTLPLGDGRAYRMVELGFDYTTGGQVEIDEDDPRLRELAMMPFWRPRLTVDDEVIQGEWVSVDGTLGVPAQAPASGDALGEGASALGGLGSDDGAETSEPPPSHLTAAWIEYTTEVPGGPARTERRELFDLLEGGRTDITTERLQSLAGRDMTDRGLSLLGSTVVLVQTAAIDADALQEAYLRDIVDTRSGRIALEFIAAEQEDDRILPSLEAASPFPLDLLSMAAARAWLSPDPGMTYLTRPNVWSTHVLFDLDGETVTSGTATDVVINDVDVRPGAEGGAVAARVRAGVLDTLLEHEFRGPGARANTWARFVDRGAQDWTWLETPDALAAVGDDRLPPSERARIASSLEAGDRVLIGPTVQTRGTVPYLDWWRVAQDGTTLGMGYRGWGAEVAGNVITRDMITQAMIRRRVQQQAIAICERFGVAANAVNVLLISRELLAARGIPLLPARRSASCVVNLG